MTRLLLVLKKLSTDIRVLLVICLIGWYNKQIKKIVQINNKINKDSICQFSRESIIIVI
jgi:hypothetical protein